MVAAVAVVIGYCLKLVGHGPGTRSSRTIRIKSASRMARREFLGCGSCAILDLVGLGGGGRGTLGVEASRLEIWRPVWI